MFTVSRVNPSLTKAVALLSGLLLVAFSHSNGKWSPVKHSRVWHLRTALRSRTKSSRELPDDSDLPALQAMREGHLSVGGEPMEFRLRGYTPGLRAVVEARAGERRVAVKSYADDPSDEAALYQLLAGITEVRAPRLLAWDSELRVIVMSWLDGPTAQELIKSGRGERAGQLAARWIRCAATWPVTLGRPFGVARMLERARRWVAKLAAADPALGSAAAELTAQLARVPPNEDTRRLVHGSLYTRHVLDLGDAVGLLDWDRFGQGPAELDAGMFLATLWRTRLRDPSLADEVERAEAAFRAGIAGLVEARALAWHRAAALLRYAERGLKRNAGNGRSEIGVLLAEAKRLAEVAG